MEVIYTNGEKPDPEEVIALFQASRLDDPITDPGRMALLLETSDILVCARMDGRLVGFARGLCDFLYSCYLSDLVVDASAQGHGIGRALIRCVSEAAGPGVRVHLMAAPEADSFYEHLGFDRAIYAWFVPSPDGPA